MRYAEFRDAIRAELARHTDGMTWTQLQERLRLPYERPCPTWTKQLEREIGLRREKGSGRILVWRLEALVMVTKKGVHVPAELEASARGDDARRCSRRGRACGRRVRGEYVKWVAEAKKAETRKRRVASVMKQVIAYSKKHRKPSTAA